MSLPIRTTLDDINAVCGYLITKPTGATLAEAKAVLDRKRLDGRKLNAMRFWGLIEENGDKLKVTDRGRRLVRDAGAFRSQVLREIVLDVAPYFAMVERVAHGDQESVTATEVATHWHEHFKDDAANTDKILNDQAVCFFQIAQAADLGELIVGRKGKPTRFDFDSDTTREFVDGTSVDTQENESPTNESAEAVGLTEEVDTLDEYSEPETSEEKGNRVFITHGKNRKILEQVKEIVTYGKFEPVVAVEHETAAEPVPQKVMGDMRKCRAAVIHVCAERILYDEERNEVRLINENVLIEIGAAMALYGDSFILLVEKGVSLPSNLQGLYECRYEGDELNLRAAMKLLKAFNEF